MDVAHYLRCCAAAVTIAAAAVLGSEEVDTGMAKQFAIGSTILFNEYFRALSPANAKTHIRMSQYGRGVFVSDEVRVGEVVMEIPEDDCLSADSIKTNPIYGDILTNSPGAAKLKIAERIALAMAAERALGPRSRFQHWIANCPRYKSPDMFPPSSWPDEEVALVEPADIRDRVRQQRSSVDKQVAELEESGVFPALREALRPHMPNSAAEYVEAAKMAFERGAPGGSGMSVVWTRETLSRLMTVVDAPSWVRTAVAAGENALPTDMSLGELICGDSFRWGISLVHSRAWMLFGERFFMPGPDFFNHGADDADRAFKASTEAAGQGGSFVAHHKRRNGKYIISSDRKLAAPPMKASAAPDQFDDSHFRQLYESYGENTEETLFLHHSFVMGAAEQFAFDPVFAKEAEVSRFHSAAAAAKAFSALRDDRNRRENVEMQIAHMASNGAWVPAAADVGALKAVPPPVTFRKSSRKAGVATSTKSAPVSELEARRLFLHEQKMRQNVPQYFGPSHPAMLFVATVMSAPSEAVARGSPCDVEFSTAAKFTQHNKKVPSWKVYSRALRRLQACMSQTSAVNQLVPASGHEQRLVADGKLVVKTPRKKKLEKVPPQPMSLGALAVNVAAQGLMRHFLKTKFAAMHESPSVATAAQAVRAVVDAIALASNQTAPGPELYSVPPPTPDMVEEALALSPSMRAARLTRLRFALQRKMILAYALRRIISVERAARAEFDGRVKAVRAIVGAAADVPVSDAEDEEEAEEEPGATGAKREDL